MLSLSALLPRFSCLNRLALNCIMPSIMCGIFARPGSFSCKVPRHVLYRCCMPGRQGQPAPSAGVILPGYSAAERSALPTCRRRNGVGNRPDGLGLLGPSPLRLLRRRMAARQLGPHRACRMIKLQGRGQRAQAQPANGMASSTSGRPDHNLPQRS